MGREGKKRHACVNSPASVKGSAENGLTFDPCDSYGTMGSLEIIGPLLALSAVTGSKHSSFGSSERSRSIEHLAEQARFKCTAT